MGLRFPIFSRFFSKRSGPAFCRFYSTVAVPCFQPLLFYGCGSMFSAAFALWLRFQVFSHFSYEVAVPHFQPLFSLSCGSRNLHFKILIFLDKAPIAGFRYLSHDEPPFLDAACYKESQKPVLSTLHEAESCRQWFPSALYVFAICVTAT